MGGSEGPGCIAALIVRDCRIKSSIALAVPRKGRGPYVVQHFGQAISFFGYKWCIVRTDQEPSTIALVDEVRASWTGELMHEKSPVAGHRANGWVESGVRTVEAQIRSVMLSLENRYNIVLDHTHSVIT